MIRTLLRAQAAALVAAFLLWASPAWPQAVLQGGPVSALGGHVPTYLPSGQGGLATVMDSGGAGGGPIGFGLSEKGLQARTPPGQGTGPLGTHDCDWDTYATNPAGAHYLCFDPNINGSSLLASALPLNFSIGGVIYPFPIGTGFAVANILTASKGGNDANNPCNNPANPCATIAHAIAEAYGAFDAGNANIQINVGPGTWNENILVNGRLRGSGTSVPVPSPCNITTCQDGQVIINGSGAGSTTITGDGHFCGTVIASDGAIVGLENATWTGNIAGCQSTLFAQIGGTINLYGGNVWGSASVGLWHAENPGTSIEVWADQTISGSATYWMTAGSTAVIDYGIGHAIFTGSPVLSTLFFMETNSVIHFNQPNVFSGSVSVSDEYQLKSGAQLLFYEPQSPKWPGGGGIGFLYSGARISNISDTSYNNPCVAGNVGCAVTSPAPTGIGAGGTISVTDGSGPYAGQVDLLTGSGPAATGVFYLSFPSILVSDTGLNGLCAFMTDIGGPTPGTWLVYSFVRGADNTIGPPSHVSFLWANGFGGSPLAPQSLLPNTDYLINYTCNN